MKNIAILGSTGTIGINALHVIQANPTRYKIISLAAGRNIKLLQEQIKIHQPVAVSVIEDAMAQELKRQLSTNKKLNCFFGTEGYIRVATLNEVDTVISAMTGAAGLIPTYEAIKAGKHIALANKETMVMAGPLVMAEAKNRKTTIFPIDSEHSAILQSLQGHKKSDLKRIILTASGGPFRDLSLKEMAKVTPAQALNHPNWNMGAKITIDSATLMNKGLEAIEAKWLFNLKMDQISILIHPESIVHSMVEYKDGSVIAQLGIPDMTIPISYALSYPRHLENQLPPLELEKIETLHFEEPDIKKYKCLQLALKATAIGGSMPAVLNGANEIAVDAFLKNKIGFLDIPELIEKTMMKHHPYAIDNIDDVKKADIWARNTAIEALYDLR